MKKAKLTGKEKQFASSNRHKFTTAELLRHINAQRKEAQHLKLTTFRTLLYKANIRRCEILRWTAEETKFLQENYATMGNMAIAEHFSTKKRKFTKRNIDKKMILMGIKRSAQELGYILEQHKKSGTYHRANKKKWADKKVQEGGRKIKMLNGKPFIAIKVNGVLVRYARYRYQQLHGKLPRNIKVYHKDMDPMNVEDDNLVAQTGRGFTEDERRSYDANCARALQYMSKQPPLDRATEEIHVVPVKKKIPVRIDYRTVVYVAPGTNIQELRNNYRPMGA